MSSLSLKFKKSFTLIELSIVLLILSLLVGSLLVGRQIVDRAKIQRIIFEFDYYEKAFHQFYDTYREVPGSFTYKNCIKYSEFEGYVCANTTCQGDPSDEKTWADHNTWCNGFGIKQSVPPKLISNHGFADDQPFAVLQASKLIESQVPRKYSSAADNQYKGLGGPSAGQWSVVTQKTNFDNNVVFEFRGILKMYLDKYGRGQEIIGLDWFLNQLADKNIMIFYDNLTTGSSRKVGGSAVSSKIAHLLDAKIDDGHPTTGRLMGLKGSAAYNITDPNLAAEYCYDKSGNNIGKAIYNNANDMKYGCDLIYVMENVK